MKIIWQFSTENSDKVYFSHITIKLTAHNYNVGKMGACSFFKHSNYYHNKQKRLLNITQGNKRKNKHTQ